MHSSPKANLRSRSRALRAAASSVVETLESRRFFNVTLEPSPAIADDTPQQFEGFGDFVAARGNYVLVGLPFTDVDVNDDNFIDGDDFTGTEDGIGEVKLFNATTGALVASIANPDPDADDFFGNAVTFIDDTRVAITSFENVDDNADVPRVYIYDITNLAAAPVTITAPGNFDFGNSLAAVGGDLLVSAPSANSTAGAVFRYNVNGTAVLHDRDAADNSITPTNEYELGGGGDAFGLVMASDGTANGTTMLFSNGFGANRRVFEIAEDGHVVRQYAEAATDGQGGSFAIAFNAESVFVGDTNVGADFSSFGRVTQFSRSGVGTVSPTAELLGAEGSGFGSSLATQGDLVIVGAQGASQVTVYDDDFTANNDPLATLVADADPLTPIAFPGAIRNLGGTKIAVGAAFAGNFEGRVFVFDLVGLGGPANVDPTAEAGADQAVVSGQPVSFDGSGSSDTDGTIELYEWDFDGDATFDFSSTSPTASHVYDNTGEFTVTLRVTDDGGATAVDTLTVNVTATLLVGGTLVVGGTGGGDNILVTASGVTVNGVTTPHAGPVVVYGGNGGDTITSDANNPFTVQLHGGDGNDVITGGGGNDFLFGEGGDDTLYARAGDDVAVGGEGGDTMWGGQGRDVLIGGDGADSIEGENADDILVAGYTVHDDDAVALAAIRDAWLAPVDYLTRVNNLRNGLLDPDTDVSDDGDEDTVVGGNGQDWFIVQKVGSVLDVIRDAKKSETTTDILP